MTPVRPAIPSLPAQRAAPADAARLAAQRAFFDAVRGQAPPAAPARPAATFSGAGPEPAKILRPGSLLDIRV